MTVKAPDANTALAVERTRLAYERTLMAWIRTAASLISFGFTIYKFFQLLTESRPADATDRLLGPRLFANAMILVGIVALTLAWIQHHLQMKALRGQFGSMPYSLAGVIAAFIAVLGIAALGLVGARL